ncbi:MAG: YadA-like family protein [Alphaproteobacteria bacterium]|jgi:autotransporter adhesin|nr:YadA-like family protein [Alphaproteobacteria bacterium]
MTITKKKLLTCTAVIGVMTGAANASWTGIATSSEELTMTYNEIYESDELRTLLLNDDFAGREQIADMLDGTPFEAMADEIANGIQASANDTLFRAAIYTNNQVASLSEEVGLYAAVFNNRLDNLSDRIEKQSKELSGGIAAATALTGLNNHLDAGKNFSIGIGTGYYNSQAAMALGGVIRTGSNHAFNAGASFGTQSAFTAKAGWNMQF